MRNDAPVVLAEWAAALNAETRTFMGVSVAPEIPERQEARAYLAGLMGDEEAAARVAADLERVHKFVDISDDAWSAPSWREAALEYYQKRGTRALIVESEPERLARARRLMAATLERAHAEGRLSRMRLLSIWILGASQVSKPSHVAASTIMAAEYLVRADNPEQLRQWLNRRGAAARKAIQKYLGGKHAAKPRTDR